MFSRSTMGQRSAIQLNRRQILRSGGVLVGAGALMQTAVVARAQGATPVTSPSAATASLELDVACDGRTFHLNPTDPSKMGKGPSAGDSFMVVGSVYPSGTIAQGLKGPDQAGSIGRWICRGAFFTDSASAPAGAPLATSAVLFILGDGISSTAGDLATAADGIQTEGLEPEKGSVHRVIVGGYGKYAGADGAQVDTVAGTNDTQIMGMMPAPNFTFRFNLTNR